MQAGAEAVKLEGDYPEQVAALVKAGIPTMGHLGMTPQSVHQFGGHRVQGRRDDGQHVIDAARRLEEAGAFAIVLELVTAELATRVTQAVSIPTIGIGAGTGCSGQIQVLHDILGLSRQQFRHAKRYTEGRSCLLGAVEGYVAEVRAGSFPGPEHSF
jgi:3-methyl-2-oxobutanoate hydroxymethyltransferase